MLSLHHHLLRLNILLWLDWRLLRLQLEKQSTKAFNSQCKWINVPVDKVIMILGKCEATDRRARSIGARYIVRRTWNIWDIISFLFFITSKGRVEGHNLGSDRLVCANHWPCSFTIFICLRVWMLVVSVKLNLTKVLPCNGISKCLKIFVRSILYGKALTWRIECTSLMRPNAIFGKSNFRSERNESRRKISKWLTSSHAPS